MDLSPRTYWEHKHNYEHIIIYLFAYIALYT